MRLLEGVNKVLEVITAIFVGLITVLVLSQVLFRYILEQPLAWSEEFSRYCLIWLVLLGFSILVRKNKHIAVTYFQSLFSDKIQRVIRIIVHFIIAFFCLILIFFGYDLAMRAMIQISPASGISMGYVDLVIPITGVISLLFTIEHIAREIIKKPLKER
jgi:TRAP-type C4-dicarboxylate transport system permease small subunit